MCGRGIPTYPHAEERRHGFLGHTDPRPEGRREEKKGGTKEWSKVNGRKETGKGRKRQESKSK